MAAVSRMIRRRLVAPMFSSRRSPEFSARGVLFGVFFAFTPLVGIQIVILAGVWAAIRAAFPQYDFNLIVAIAWVWVTNVVTVPPVYFGFIVTGQMMLGRWDEPLGYEAYTSRLEISLAGNHSVDWLQGLWLRISSLLEAFGLPLFVGWIPWAIVLSIVGYYWALKFVVRVRASRAQRRSKRRQARIDKQQSESA